MTMTIWDGTGSRDGGTSHPFGPSGSGREGIDELRGVAGHLALAASELARDPRFGPDQRAQFAAAEARYRAQAADLGGLRSSTAPPVPVVRLPDGISVSLTELLTVACRRERRWVANASIDPDVIAGAKDLLCGLRWHLPDLDHSE